MIGYPFALWNALYQIATTRKIDAYLEVGVCRGLSLEVILREQFPNRLTLCDTWGGMYGGESFGNEQHIVCLLAKYHYPHPVQYLNGSSHDLLKTVEADFDLITVDGDHSPSGARQDLEECWRLLRPKGLLVFDDLAHPSHRELLAVFHDFARRVDADIVCEDLRQPMGVGVLCKTS